MFFMLSFTQELNHSYIKQEMIRLHETLTALEVKRDTMLAEEKTLVSPQEEREKLFKQVGFTVQRATNTIVTHTPLIQNKTCLDIVLDRIKDFLVKCQDKNVDSVELESLAENT